MTYVSINCPQGKDKRVREGKKRSYLLYKAGQGKHYSDNKSLMQNHAWAHTKVGEEGREQGGAPG